MHLSPAKNLRDYFAFFLVVSIFSLICIWLLMPNADRALAIAPLMGFVSGLSAFFRDGQHRQVPPALSASPRRFAQESTVILDNGVDQMKSLQQMALSLQQSAVTLADAVSTARQVLSAGVGESNAEGVYLGKGFE